MLRRLSLTVLCMLPRCGRTWVRKGPACGAHGFNAWGQGRLWAVGVPMAAQKLWSLPIAAQASVDRLRPQIRLAACAGQGAGPMWVPCPHQIWGPCKTPPLAHPLPAPLTSRCLLNTALPARHSTQAVTPPKARACIPCWRKEVACLSELLEYFVSGRWMWTIPLLRAF